MLKSVPLYPYTTDASVECYKKRLKSYEEDIKQISSWSNNHNNFPVIIAGVAFKLENIDPNFSCFNPLTMSILAIHRNRLQETVSMLT